MVGGPCGGRGGSSAWIGENYIAGTGRRGRGRPALDRRPSNRRTQLPGTISSTGVLYSYWSGLSGLGASFHARPDRLILVWPTNDDLTCIYVAWPHKDFRQVRKNVEPEFHAALDLVPGLRRGSRIRPARTTLRRHRRSAQPVPDLSRAGLGVSGRRRPPQGPLDGHGHVRRVRCQPNCSPKPSMGDSSGSDRSTAHCLTTRTSVTPSPPTDTRSL